MVLYSLGFPANLEIREHLEKAFYFFQLGRNQEFEEKKCFESGKIREFDLPKRESGQGVIDSFSGITFTQAQREESRP